MSGSTSSPRRATTLLAIAALSGLVAITAIATIRDDRTARIAISAGGAPGSSTTLADAPASTTSTTPTTSTTVSETSTTTSSTTTSTTAKPAAGAEPLRWTRTEGSLRADVEASASRFEVGQIITFTVRLRDEGGSIVRAGIDYGDGTPTGIPAAMEVDCGASGERVTEGVDKTITFVHGYRVPGAVQPKVVVRSAGCGRPERVLELERSLTLVAAPSLTNGPVAPSISIQRTASGGPKELRFVVAATDLDGQVRSVIVRWNDGTEDQVVPLSGRCTDNPRFWLPTHETIEISRTYAEAGERQVEVTVESSGCAGRDLQRASQSTRATL